MSSVSIGSTGVAGNGTAGASGGAGTLTGFARVLAQTERLSVREADEITRLASASRRSFLDQIVVSGRFPAREMAELAAATFGLPLFDLDSLELDGIPLSLVDRKLIEARRVLPLRKRGNKLSLALADPTSQQTLDEVKFQTGLVIEPVVVEHDKLASVIQRALAQSDPSLRALSTDELSIELDAAVGPATEEVAQPDVDDAPVVRFIQKVLTDAIADGASDIHFEPYEKFYRIRVRVDGELREVTSPPVALKERIASRLKVVARMDIAEKRVPQDGRFKLPAGRDRSIEFRVSSLPTLNGEKLVLRILDSNATALSIDTLGYEPDQKEAILKAIHRPHGMILVTGPTGSGKTISLYSFLSILNRPGVNISTAEDPAEIYVAGINQVAVNDKAGLTFATALRSFLRQDPDIIMVGEIRDIETAEISVKAAQTGHLLLSTLHTNDAPASLTRLVAMGIPAFNIASSVILITAQRLARRLCQCKAPVNLPEKALLGAGFALEELEGGWVPYGPVGCDRCRNSGYRGRIGIYQVMPITDEMSRLIMRGGNEIEIADLARKQGVRDLRQSGLRKVKEGITSLEEVMAVTNE